MNYYDFSKFELIICIKEKENRKGKGKTIFCNEDPGVVSN
jgi:hypothetical protein